MVVVALTVLSLLRLDFNLHSNPYTLVGLARQTCIELTLCYSTETCVAPDVDASRYFLFFIFLRTSSVGGGYAARLLLLFSFPCSADHERVWPPCKVVFSGWYPISYAECEKQQTTTAETRKTHDKIILLIINDTLARSLEPVATECKEHTIHTQTQIVASRKPKEMKHTHEGEANFTT